MGGYGLREPADPWGRCGCEVLEGKVVDDLSREPVAGATVTVMDPPGAGSAVSGEEGAFSLPAASEEALLLEVRAEGYPPASVKVAPERQASGEPLEVELLPGGRVHVSPWDEESDIPCTGCSVSLMVGGRSHSLVTDTQREALSELLAPDQYQVSLVRMRSLGGVVQVSGGDAAPSRPAQRRLGHPQDSFSVAEGSSAGESLLPCRSPPDPGRKTSTSIAEGYFRVKDLFVSEVISICP
ncbi:MAG TPA: carboxypeptidase regulatory-like domain-containing protein [Thermoanaerobaculia bacterium]|nr:carboxypeptidase regulatory-like domain-containing protein [Thermoanaerobaculia bacterium]